MEVTKLIEVDLATRGVTNKVDVVQFDSNTRIVKTVLYENGLPWVVPDGVQVVFSYKKPDKTVGMYDQMPDGSPAATVEENVIFLKLAPQVMTAKGVVHCNIVMYAADGDSLATFPINVLVAENQQAEVMDSVDYINMGYVQYDTKGKENVIPETTTTDSAVVNGSYSIIDGDSYVVLFNGTEFSCTAKYTYQSATVEYWDIRPAKSLSAEYPFYVRVYPNSWRLFLYDKTQSATVSVWKPVPQISSKHIAALPMSKVDGLEEALKNAGGGVTSWNDLTDRPFYEEREETVVLEESALELDESFGFVLPSQLELVVGDTYEVGYNGDTYRSVCVEYVEGGVNGGWMLGNYGAMTGGEDTGEPFVLVAFNTEGYEMYGAVVPFDETTSAVTASITHVVETIKKLDPKFVEADWNTMLNKPFGTTEEYGTVLAESELALNAQLGAFIITEDFVVKAGREYTVVYNGATYVTRAVKQTQDDGNGNEIAVVLLGNLAMDGGEDTGEPFAIMYGAEFLQMQGIGGYAALMPLDGAESVTLSISGLTEVVHKLDPKYMDVPDWNAREGEPGYIKNRTHYKHDEVVFFENLPFTPTDGQMLLDERLDVAPGQEYRLSSTFGGSDGVSGDPEYTVSIYGTARIQEGGIYIPFYSDEGDTTPTFAILTCTKNTEEEFVAQYGAPTLLASPNTSTGAANLTLVKPKEVKKLDPEFIPPAPIPHFDLVAMGLDVIPENGDEASNGALDAPDGIAAIRSALDDGMVSLSFDYASISHSNTLHATAVVTKLLFQVASYEDTNYYALANVITVTDTHKFATIMFRFETNRVHAWRATTGG